MADLFILCFGQSIVVFENDNKQCKKKTVSEQ